MVNSTSRLSRTETDLPRTEPPLAEDVQVCQGFISVALPETLVERDDYVVLMRPQDASFQKTSEPFSISAMEPVQDVGFIQDIDELILVAEAQLTEVQRPPRIKDWLD